MTALDVISLDDAKSYLKVDFADDDTMIEGLIKSAIRLVEKNTNYRLWNRPETIFTSKCHYEAFQYPFYGASVANQDQTDTTVYDVKIKYETLRTKLFWGNGFDYFDTFNGFFAPDLYNINGQAPITYILNLNVGYQDVNDIPDDLMTAIKQLIVYMYDNRDLTRFEVPDNIQILMASYQRFSTIL